MFAGLVDSLCLSFAWTVLMLQVVSDYGLGAAGLVSAAMLVGVALSAPVASRLACLLDGRRLLRSAAAVEAVLRVAVFALLVTGAPLLVLVACVSADERHGLDRLRRDACGGRRRQPGHLRTHLVRHRRRRHRGGRCRRRGAAAAGRRRRDDAGARPRGRRVRAGSGAHGRGGRGVADPQGSAPNGPPDRGSGPGVRVRRCPSRPACC